MGYENPHFVSKADLYASRDEWRRKYLDLFNEAGDYKDRAEQAEAREDAWVNEEQIQRTRAEQAEASLAAERERAEMWEWVARHEFVCPLGEMNPGEAGSYVVERGVHDALVARYAARPAPEEETP